MPLRKRKYKEKLRNRKLFGYFVISAFLFTGLTGVVRHQWDNILHVLALTSVSLNSGTTTLSTYSPLAATLVGLGDPQAAFTWEVDSNNIFTVNVPFNSGATQFEYSGFASNGTNVNSPVFHTEGSGNCQVGGCMEFDGFDQYVSFPDPTRFGRIGGDEITLSGWIYPRRATNFIVGRAENNSTYGNYAVDLNSQKLRFRYRNSGQSQNHRYEADPTIPLNTWTHFSVSYTFADGDSIRVYINGSLVSGTWNQGDGNDQPLSLCIGPSCQLQIAHWYGTPDGTNDAYHFDGFLDEIKVWEREISADQVLQNYNDGNSNNAGPTQILDDETVVSEVWDLDVTPFDSGGSPLAQVNSSNTVTITSPTITASLNSGVTTLSSYSDLPSNVTGLGTPQAGYTWTKNATNLLSLNLPFNAGATLFDYSGNSKNGTLNGATFNRPGSGRCQVGGCLSFDGVDDWVGVTDGGDFDFANTTFTVSGWFNSTATADHGIFYNGGLIGDGGWGLLMGYSASPDGAMAYTWPDTVGVSQIYTSDTFNDGSWHHFAVVITTDTTTAGNNDAIFYVDGTERATTRSINDRYYINTTSDISIGARKDSNHFFWDGELDEIQVYPYELSQTQITQLYNDGNSNNAGPTQIVGAETTSTDVWDLGITPFESDGSVLTQVNSSNTVTISAPTVTASLNSGTTTLSTYSDLASNVSGLGSPQAAYNWTIGGTAYNQVYLPFTAGVAADFSGNGNNGVLNGSAAISNAHTEGCVVGECLDLQANTDFVSLPTLVGHNYCYLSGAIWVYPRDIASGGGLFDYGDSSDGSFTVGMGLNPGGAPIIQVRKDAGSYYTVVSPDTIAQDQWHHIAFNYDGVLRLYVNGVEKGSLYDGGGCTFEDTPNDAFVIGMYDLGVNNGIDGLVDEFHLSENKLTQAQAMRMYLDGNSNNAGPTQIADDQTLISELWSLDVTPFESDGSSLSQVNSSNTVTIIDPAVTAQLNSGITTLSTFSDLPSNIVTLGTPQAAYSWTIGANRIAELNLPFNPTLTQDDRSGNGNNGTLTNGAFYHVPGSDCVAGGCIEVDGVDDVVTGGTTNFPTGSSDRTISLWAKSDDFATGNIMLFGYGTAVNDGMSALVVGLNNLTDRNFGFWGYFADLNSGAGVLNNGAWNHLAATIINNTVTLYHDGVAITSQNFPGLNTSSGSTYYIGDFTSTMGNFDGLIDEVQVFDRGFSADQITRLYNDGNSNNAGPTQIVDDETASTEVWDVDITPFESDGTALSQVNSSNTVTITAPAITVGLNNGINFLDNGSNLTSQVTGLGNPAGAYRWEFDSTRFMSLNIPFNSGATQNDYSGNLNNGTIGGGAVFTKADCQVGGCIQLDGVDGSQVLSSDDNSLDITGPFSISAWIKSDVLINSGSGNTATIAVKGQNGGSESTMTYGIWIRGAPFTSNRGKVEIKFSDGTFTPNFFTDQDVILADTWYHIVGTWDGTDNTGFNIYIDGVDQSGTIGPEDASTIKVSADTFSIGASSNGTRAFDGLIDEVQVYNRALSQSQVTQLFNDGNSNLAGPTQIVAAETTVGEVWDLSGVWSFDSSGAQLNGENSTNTVTIINNLAPNIPVLVDPADASTVNNLSPTLSANFSDPGTGAGSTGTTEYRVSSGSSTDCINNVNVVDSGSSATTSSNNEDTSRVVGVILSDLTTYNWCARNFDTLLFSNGGAFTAMGSFTVDSSFVPGGTSQQKQEAIQELSEPVEEEPVQEEPVEEEVSQPQEPIEEPTPIEEPVIEELAPQPELPQQELEEAPGDNQPPPAPEPPQQEESTNIEQILNEIIDQEAQETAEGPSRRPEPTPSETGIETNSQSDGRSFTIEVEDRVLEDELIVTGLAQTEQDRIEFTGQTSEPNSTVTLIFNNNVTVVVTSDQDGFWQTFVSAEQLGIAPGQSASVQIDAIAAKGDLRSDKVSVGFVQLNFTQDEEIIADFENIVDENELFTDIQAVVRQVDELIEQQEEVIQQTLTITAPVVVAASAPLWGYLPYIPTLVYHFVTYLVGLIGRRKQEGESVYGTVYDAITKKPLGLVVLRIYKLAGEKQQLVATRVSDKLGRYDLLLEPGEYRIEAKKPQYIYPSKIESFSPTVSVTAENLSTPDIPLDPIDAVSTFALANIFKKFWLMFQRIGHILALPVLLVGAIASVFTVAAVPASLENWILAAMYIFLFALQLRLRPVIEKAWGVVYDLVTSAPLPLTTIQLVDPEYGKVVTSRLTDYQGRFAFLPEPGKYIVKASKEGYEQAEVVESGNKKYKPVSGQVDIQKEGDRIKGDIAMRQL